MPKNEDGEYELVLGNRQLLSIFFIVVVLLGVGFTLGYLLGRNSVTTTADAQPTPTTASAKVDLPQPPPESKPAAASSEPPTAPTTERETPKRPAAAPMVDSPATRPFRTGPPPTGAVFLQVAAVAKGDAEMEATTLSKKGFPTWIAPNEKNPELFSVLVGPLEDKTALAKAKSGLEDLGFRKAFRKEIK